MEIKAGPNGHIIGDNDGNYSSTMTTESIQDGDVKAMWDGKLSEAEIAEIKTDQHRTAIEMRYFARYWIRDFDENEEGEE